MTFRILMLILTLAFFQSKLMLISAEDLKPLKTSSEPKIDGVLDDEVWQFAPSVTNFKTFIPDFGRDMHEKTIVYMAYDENNLYFAFQCYDSEPNQIKASLTNRDNIRAEDWVCINLDTYGDQQSLTALYVNPLGVQADSRFASGAEDEGIDYIWYSAGRIDDKGYSVEMQIPLESIRYSTTEPVKMAVFFERKISRYSEQGSYPELDPDMGYAFLTQLKPIIYEDLEGSSVRELLPAFTYNRLYKNSEGILSLNEDKTNISLNAKYGITSGLILDATYNPDFSQVESDASEVEVNLRSSIIYPEKRPFFLEGRENFNLSALRSSELDPLIYIVHTRTIASPLAGLKLTGNIGSKSNIALLYAVDDLEEIFTKDTSLAHNTILRYKYALEGDSYLGAIYAGKELKDYSNRLLGLDGALRINNAATLEYNGFLSATKETDSESKYTNAFTLKYGYTTRDLDYVITAQNIERNFKADMGYMRRDGIQMATALIRPKLFPEESFIQRIDIEGLSSVTKDLYYDKLETFNHLSALFLFGGTYQLKVKYSYSTETFKNEIFQTGGFHVFGGGHITNQLYLGVLFRNRGSILYSSNPLQGRSNILSANLIYHPSDQIEGDLSFIFSDFTEKETSEKLYEVPITRFKITYQLNKYLFFRGITEYNNYDKSLNVDFLASFTYIPGTVFHIGYGSFYEKVKWRDSMFVPSDKMLETRRGLFIKMSYLWRV